jgi:hemoglobin/transferrin/lactoferrin receptor protein
MKKVLGLSYLLGFSLLVYGQDSLLQKTMEGITVSANKRPQNINEVPNKITKINRTQILQNNPQTSADLLSQSGTVFVQKSQLGGGSPMIRGFATNRVLLVMDGVRMNNAIYRSGNLQNVISIDPLSIETAEVIFGPGSLIYGSDAIGGVMDFHSLQPRLSQDSNLLFKGNVFSRYSSANKEKTFHADFTTGSKKMAFLGSLTYSDFDDLKMGKQGGQDSYLRQEYIERTGNADVIVQNNNPRVQRFSGYHQTNFLGKWHYQPLEGLNFQYNFTYAKTGTAPRYDRLIQYRNGALRFAEWNYGPMLWNMHSFYATYGKKTAVSDNIVLIAAYQDYEESRIERVRGNNNRTTQTENVNAYSINADATKNLWKGTLYYGVEFVHNLVGSKGSRTNITTGNVTPFISRYPDDSKWGTAGIYGSYKINPHPKVTLTTGLRYSYNYLEATFDPAFINFPYKEAKIDDGALTGNAAIIYRPTISWQLSANTATGYRMPNIDDIGKVFESSPGFIIVPNPELRPEYAWNFELGIVKSNSGKLRIELNGFYTFLDNAIVRRPFLFNGMNTINFDGTPSKVEALQNVAKATVWGVQAGLKFNFTPYLHLQTNANWIDGKETDDTKDEQVALRHAPPFYGSTHLRFEKNKWYLEAYSIYNSEIENKDLAPSEKAKADIYAKDELGLPYSPAWTTFNFKASYQFNKHLFISTGWENISNLRYRPYSSGIVAAGSNVIVALKASF